MSQKQKMRYDDKELSLIKHTFAEDDEIITLIRKVFLQDKLTKEDTNKLSKISESPALLKMFKKTFLPDIELDAPIHQVVDLWLSVDVKDKSPEQAITALKIRCALKDWIALGLQRLESLKEKGVTGLIDYKPDFTKDVETQFVELTARNALIQHVEFQISQLNTLAGQKAETIDELKKRLEKNSTK